MTICFTVVNISNCGGTERVLLSITDGLVKNGFDVHILTYYGNGVPFFSHNAKSKIHVLLSLFECKYFSNHPKYLIWKSKLLIRRIHPDIVIDTDLLTPNLTIPALRGSDIKHAAWDNMSYEYFKKAIPERLALGKMIGYGSHLFVLTHLDYENYINKEFFPVKNIHQIYNPLTIAEVPYQKRNIRKVISVGRFANEKGFDLLLKAWKIVEQSVNDWTLEIWGDAGQDTGNVHKTFESLNLKNAFLYGTTSNIEKIYEDASIYVLPSRYEPFGLVLVEASAKSLPLIAFNCPNGPREIIREGENGFLVKPENVDALAAAILRLVGNKELRDRMGRNAYERSRDFQMDKIIPQWERLFESIAN